MMGKEGEVHGERVHGAGDEERAASGEDGLQRLDGVGEGHGDGGKGGALTGKLTWPKAWRKEGKGHRLEGTPYQA